MTSEQANAIREALGGSHEADHDVAVGACLQSADELSLLGQAMQNGASGWLVANGLLGIENRLRAAAKLAGAVEIAADADEKSEAAQ